MRATTRFAAATALTALAAAPAYAGGFERNVEAGVESAYVFRGLQLAEETAVAKGYVELGPLYGGAQIRQPFGDESDALPTETRLSAGLARDRLLGLAGIDVGVTQYIFSGGEDGVEPDDRLEIQAGVYFNVLLNPDAYVYYDTDEQTLTVQASVGQYVPLGGLRGLEFSAAGGSASGDDIEDYVYLEAEADFIQGFGNGIEGFVGARAAVASEENFFDDLDEDLGPTFGEDGVVWAGGGVRAKF